MQKSSVHLGHEEQPKDSSSRDYYSGAGNQTTQDIYQAKRKEFEQIRTHERSGIAVSKTVNERSKSV